MQKKFPDGFPVNNCPPNDSFDAHGTYFRFVRGEVGNKKNFIPVANRSNSKNQLLSDCLICESYGLSMLGTIKSARLMRRMPAFKNKKIARGHLEPICGKMKHTPRDGNKEHYTLWVYEGVNIADFFELVEEN